MQTTEQKKLMADFNEFVQSNHLSLAYAAKQLGVAQNTISNWRKGASISSRNQRRILDLIATDAGDSCNVSCCSLRNGTNPLARALLEVAGTLPERNLAKLYAFALELRDLPGQYEYISHSVEKAAETQAPFNEPSDKEKQH